MTMRPLAWLIITLSLIVAIVAAVPAYSPKLSLPDSHLVGKTLNAPAGAVKAPDGSLNPISTKGTVLTAELLSKLRAAGVERVKVKEFSFGNWSERWYFLLGCAGLFAGAMLARAAKAQQLARVASGPDAPEPPEDVLKGIVTEVRVLRNDLPRMPDSTRRLDAIIDRIGKLSAESVPAFVAGRALLISRMGLGGYAQLMDRFAAGERQLNRAWSAAADGYEEEAVECLETAAAVLEEAEQRIR
jgi:hypothetical protein